MRKRNFIAGVLVVGLCVTAMNPEFVKPGKAAEEEAEAVYIVVTDGTDTKQVLSQVDKKDCIFAEDTVLCVSMTESEAEKLAETDGIETVEKDIEIQGFSGEQNQDEAEAEWNMQMIHADEIRENSGEGIKVAVVDSGINYSDDISVVERRYFVEGDESISVLYEDGSGHGTAVAGIIAARDNDMGITGVAPDVDIYSARVLDDKNRASLSKVIAAIEWAIEKDVDIINLSLGCTQDSQAFHNVLKKAKQKGILVIAAAGNGGEVKYPAAYEEVLAVGSVGTDGIAGEESAVGSQLELVAPGEQILSTGMFDGVMTCGGTSMAAAHVTGVAAALWGMDKSVSSEFVRKLMDASAREYDDKNTYGYGLVDLGSAYANYEDMKALYEEELDVEELTEATGLEENDADIEVYEDVPYVEGLWGTNQHKLLADQGVLSGTELAIMKLGAVANDEYIQGMKANPQWHGFFKTESGTTINYVGCYMYVSRVAKNIGSGNYTAESVSGDAYDSYVMSYVINSSGFNGTSWATILNGYSNTNRNKQLLVYGMALHIATDTFAHSAFDTKGKRVAHGDEYVYPEADPKAPDGTYSKAAHNEAVYPNRYTCANEIARNVLSKCSTQSNGTVSDYLLSSYKGVYKMKNMSSYISAINATYYNNHKSDFDDMNI